MSTLSLTSAVEGVGGHRHAAAALPPAKRQEVGWAPPVLSGQVRKLSPPTALQMDTNSSTALPAFSRLAVTWRSVRCCLFVCVSGSSECRSILCNPNVQYHVSGYNSQDGARPALTDFPFSVLFSNICIMRTVCV
jgi:hypothetical protein